MSATRNDLAALAGGLAAVMLARGAGL
jgi:hypothetical protein